MPVFKHLDCVNCVFWGSLRLLTNEIKKQGQFVCLFVEFIKFFLFLSDYIIVKVKGQEDFFFFFQK